MKMSGEQRIAAPRAQVWDALNDPDILSRCIPGCQSLEQDADGRMRAVVEVKIGPIGARFSGAVTISDADPPVSYRISGEGQGGTVGTAKGGAVVRLSEDGGATLLAYDVDAQVGGRLAQLGGPIIDATAKQLAAKFFREFGEVVAGGATPASPAPVSVAALDRPAAPKAWPVAWLLALLCAGLIGYLAGSAHGEYNLSIVIGVAAGLLIMIVARLIRGDGR